MGVALAALDFCARHSHGFIAGLDHVLLGDGLPEAGPAGARLELGFGAEESVVATDAAIDSLVVVVPGDAGVGALCAGLAGDGEGDRGELLLPLRVGLGDVGNGRFAGGFAEVGKLNDGDGGWASAFAAGFNGGKREAAKGPESSCSAGTGRESNEGATAWLLNGRGFRWLVLGVVVRIVCHGDFSCDFVRRRKTGASAEGE